MDPTTRFLEMLERLCQYRGMYVPRGTFYEVCAYLTGYAEAAADCPLSNDGWKAFGLYVCVRFHFPENYAWPHVLKICSKDDDEAVAFLRTMLTEFSNQARTSSYDEIIQAEILRTANQKEGEPELVLRKLLAALLRGSQQEIEPLIQDPAAAAILWQGAYPSNVADQLEAISNDYPIARIAGSEDEGMVRLITADFPFPITAKLIDGNWKIDASQIVESRQAATPARPCTGSSSSTTESSS